MQQVVHFQTSTTASCGPRTRSNLKWSTHRSRSCIAHQLVRSLQSQNRVRCTHAACFSSVWCSAAVQPSSPAVKLAVFVSGGGSNFKAIHQHVLAGRIQADIAVVVSNNPACGGCTYARDHGIPVLIYPASKKYADGLTPQQLVARLQEHGVDYVILAGYLKLIPPELVQTFPRRMLNIHPGLLPSFGGPGMYGQRVHAAVIASGARFSGPSVHFVDEEYDSGAILAQRVVPVLPDDTPEMLAARVLQQEHQVYPEAVAALCEGRVEWRDDGIPYMWTKK